MFKTVQQRLSALRIYPGVNCFKHSNYPVCHPSYQKECLIRMRIRGITSVQAQTPI
jgi:hypothetical protein